MGSLLIGLVVGFVLGIATTVYRYFFRPDDEAWIMLKAGKAAARYMESLNGEPMTAEGENLHVGDSPLGERWILDYQLYRERYADQMRSRRQVHSSTERAATPKDASEEGA